ncbi:hypothetical protein MYX65_01920 [Acidobacteria bacterium AH-259-L09]|nr:hypothetical protein [Acidobacteria bacterium AH-259-L09]
MRRADRWVLSQFAIGADGHQCFAVSKTPVLPFSSAFLYLPMSGHSNYRSREIFFDDILVREACEEE